MPSEQDYVKLQNALDACQAAISKTYSAEDIVNEVKNRLGVSDDFYGEDEEDNILCVLNT